MKMNIRDFQTLSVRTMNKELTKEQQISNTVFGANGELGEVTDILKKYLYQGHRINKQHLAEEIGDTLFYIVNLCTLFNLDIEDILQGNVDKLRKRFPNGFEVDRSINR